MIKDKFEAATEKYRDNFTFIYTDVPNKDDRVGSSLNFRFSSKLPETSICKAETVAIYEAIKIAINKNLKRAIIFSDSSSAISKINKNLFLSSADYWTLRTKRLLYLPNKHGLDFYLAWIPGHSGIQGNIEADILANLGRIVAAL